MTFSRRSPSKVIFPHPPLRRDATPGLTESAGARAYYLHSVLHDWSNEKCAEILANLKPVMTKGYSKLLITEHIIPDHGASWVSTTLDMIMMCCFAAGERTASDWEKLLGNAGFKIMSIKGCEPGTESLMEVELI